VNSRRLRVEAKPDMTDPWTGEAIVLPPRTIGLLAADATDPWTGEKLDVPPPGRTPMPDDHPFDATNAKPEELRADLVIKTLRVDAADPFR
jgi:hypothetical protein